MRRFSTLLVVLIALGITTGAAAGPREERREEGRRVVVPVGIAAHFYEALAPFGVWVDLPPYGDVWVPDAVPAGWRPYTDGQWLYTDDGWTWVSNFDWGWAPFHYGRWAYDPGWGWVWIPGDVWAPAWVSWRIGDGFIGWAPLPPDAVWVPGMGLEAGFDFDTIPAAAWVFVDPDDFVRPILPERVMRTDRDDAYLRRSHAEGRYAIDGGRVVNRGVEVESLERGLGRPVERYRVVAGESPRSEVSGQTVHLFRPAVPALPVTHQAPLAAADEGRAAAIRQHAEQQRLLLERQQGEAEQMRQRQLEERQQLLHSYSQHLPQKSVLSRQQLDQRQVAEQHWLATRPQRMQAPPRRH